MCQARRAYLNLDTAGVHQFTRKASSYRLVRRIGREVKGYVGGQCLDYNSISHGRGQKQINPRIGEGGYPWPECGGDVVFRMVRLQNNHHAPREKSSRVEVSFDSGHLRGGGTLPLPPASMMAQAPHATQSGRGPAVRLA